MDTVQGFVQSDIMMLSRMTQYAPDMHPLVPRQHTDRAIESAATSDSTGRTVLLWDAGCGTFQQAAGGIHLGPPST